MTMSERIATIGIVHKMSDPKFDSDEFLDIDDYFLGGYEDQRFTYYKDKERKEKDKEKAIEKYREEKKKMFDSVFKK